MEMKTVILISFSLGVLSGWGSDHAKKNFYGKLTIIDHLVVLPTILFVVYSFFQSISFGFMAILQLLLGMYIGRNSNKLVKRVFKR